MSINLHIKASRKAKVINDDGSDIDPLIIFDDKVEIGVWQTPSKETLKITGSEDPLEAYFEWVDSISSTETMKVYHDPEDEFKVDFDLKKDSPDLYDLVEIDYGKEHKQDVLEEINFLKKLGYKIIFEAY